MLHMRSMKKFALGGIVYLLICSNGGHFLLVLVCWFIFLFLLTFCAVGRLFGAGQNRFTWIAVKNIGCGVIHRAALTRGNGIRASHIKLPRTDEKLSKLQHRHCSRPGRVIRKGGASSKCNFDDGNDVHLTHPRK